MNPAKLTDALSGLGFDIEAARTRALLVDTAVRCHAQDTGRAPVWAWVVPGRIEIFGKHTDYAGGRSLIAAVPRGFAVVASPRRDGVICVRDARTREERAMDAADVATAFSGWFRYVAVVVRRLARNFPGAPLGADVTFTSDLPRAAGLSSSSVLIVSMATALSRAADLEARPEWRAAVRSRHDLAGYLGAMESGLSFGLLAGDGGIGTHGGSEDHTAILTCRAGYVSACRFVPIRPIGDVAMPEDWCFVIASSGIKADKAGAAQDRYNRASLATRALVDLWNAARGSDHATLAEVLSSAPNAAADLWQIVGETTREDFSADELARRLAHFIAEDGRILDAMQAFRSADRQAVGALANGSQTDARHLLANQTDETAALARLAIETGAFAATSFGAGFGGSVWALVLSAEAPAFCGRWVAAYRTQHPHVSGVECLVARPAPSLAEVRPT